MTRYGEASGSHVDILTLIHDCMRLSGMFFMLTIGGGSAEMKHLRSEATMREIHGDEIEHQFHH